MASGWYTPESSRSTFLETIHIQEYRLDSDRLNRWLSLIANIGVVVGLFLLIAEVNHASRLAEVEAYQTRIRDIQELNIQLGLSDSLADILSKADSEGVESLTPSEFRRAKSWYSAIMRGMQGQYYQYQNGFLDRVSIDRTLTDIADGIYEQWERYDLLDNIEIQEWRAEIDQALAGGNET